MYNQNINSTSIKTSVMETTIETRVTKVGDLVIIKEEYILYKGNPFEHVFIFLSTNSYLMSTLSKRIGNKATIYLMWFYLGALQRVAVPGIPIRDEVDHEGWLLRLCWYVDHNYD